MNQIVKGNLDHFKPIETMMKFLCCILFILISGCQVKEASNSNGVVEGHVPTTYKFTALTQLNKVHTPGDQILIALTFPKAVTVTGTPSVKVTIGTTARTASYTSGSGTTSLIFSYAVQNGDEDTDGISLSTALDLNGATLTYDTNSDCGTEIKTSNFSTVLVDSTVPTILNVTPPSSRIYTSGQNVDVKFKFSEKVTVSGSPFLPVIIGSSTVNSSYLSGSGTDTLTFRYTVSATDEDSDGIEVGTIDTNGGAIQDKAEFDANLTFTAPNTAGVIIAGSNALITSITSPTAGTYQTDDNLEFNVTFNQPVVVTLSPRIAITTSSGTVYANYLSGAGTTNLVFQYTVSSGDFDIDGIEVVSPIEPNGGAIQNVSMTSSALLNFTPPTTSSIIIDGIDPIIETIIPPANGQYGQASNLDFTVQFSSPVAVTGTPRLSLTVGSTSVFANYQSGNGTDSLIFRYTVSGGDNDLDGLSMTSPLQTPVGASIKDIFGDSADLNFTSPDMSSIFIDTAAPTITSVAAPSDGTYYLNDYIDFTVTFSEAVNITGGLPQLALTIGSSTKYASYNSGSGSNSVVFRYSVGNSDVDLDGINLTSPLSLNSGSIKDLAGNNLSPLTFSVPNTSGILVNGAGSSIISITPPSAGTYKTGEDLDFIVNFSSAVTVTGAPLLSLNIGGVNTSAEYISGSGSSNLTFRYTVSAGDIDSDGIGVNSPVQLNSGTIQDVSNNNATLTFTPPNTSSILVDGIDLIISSITPSADKTYVIGESIDFSVAYNYSAVVTGTPRIQLTIGASTLYADYVTGTGTNNLTFRYTVGSGNEDSDGIDTANGLIDLNSGTIKDQFGDNASLVFTVANYPNKKVDGIAPSLISVTPPSPGTYQASDSVNFIITSSESLSVTGSPRILLTVGSSTKYATYISGSGSTALTFTYNVASGDSDSDGLSSSSPIDLNSGTIKDIAGNNLSSLIFTPPDTSSVIIDAATISIIAVTTPVDATYKTGENLDFVVQFSGNASVTGAPRIAVTIGSNARWATYQSGSGSEYLTFRYTVAAGAEDADGISMASSISLNGGTILSAFNQAASLTFTAPDTSGILIDGIDLAIASITPPNDNTYIYNQDMDFTVNYNYPAQVTGSPRIQLTVGTNTRYATYQSGSGSTALLFRYTVPSGDEDTDGIDTAGTSLDLNSGTIKDNFGDNALIAVTATNYPNKKVDGIVPSIQSVAGTSPGTYYENDNLDFTVTYSDSITVAGIPRIQLDIGGVTKYATYLSGSGTPVHTFRYTVVSGDEDLNGVTSVSPVDLNSGTLLDHAGNSVTPLTFTPPNTALTYVDATNAAILSINPPANGKYITSDNVDFNVYFNRPVTVTGTPRIVLDVGGATKYANYQSGSGTATLVFRYAVSAGDKDTDGLTMTSPLGLNSGTIKDSYNNAATLTYTLPDTTGVKVDGINLTIASITLPPDGNYIYNQNMDFVVNYNYAPIVTGSPRIQLDVGGATKYATYQSGSGTTALTFRYSVGATDLDTDGIATAGSSIDLNSGTIEDDFGDAAAITITEANYPNKYVDGVVPTISSVTAPTDATYYENEDLNFQVNFSEPVTVTGTPRLTLGIGASTRYATYLTGAGTPTLLFTYSVVGGDIDTNGISLASSIDLNAGTLKDLLGNNVNPLTFTAPLTSGINVDANTASIIGVTPPSNATYKTATNLDFSVQFSRVVNVTGTPRISLTFGSSTVYANYLSGSGSNTLSFRYVIQPGDKDTDGIGLNSPITLNGGTVKDTSNNAATLTYSAPDTTGVLIDGIDLVIASITPPADKTYLFGEYIDFIVNYNYAATITGVPRLQLTVGTNTRYAEYFSGSGSTSLTFRYVVTASDVDTDGIDLVGPSIGLNSGTIQDEFSDNAGLLYSSGNYPNKKVDGIAPFITSVSGPSSGTYYQDEHFDFIITMSEVVNVTGIPQIPLVVGSSTMYATYVEGTGTNLLTFRYTVVSGHYDNNGIVAVSPLDLNGGTIKDGIGNNLSALSFTSPNTTGVLVDGTAASILGLTPPANGTYKTGNNLDFVVNFSRPVNITGSPRISITLSSGTVYANYNSGTGTTALTFRYTVGANDIDGDGIILTSPVALNSGTIKDSSNNDATLTYSLPSTVNIWVDGVTITIASITPPANGLYKLGDELSFIVNFSHPTTITGLPQLQLTVGSSTTYANYVSGTGTTSAIFKYIVQSGNFDDDGITSVGPSLLLNSGTLKDQFGDDITRNFTAQNYFNIKVDGVLPTISSIAPPPNATYNLGSNLDFTVTFNEIVTISGSPRLILTVGAVTRYATYFSGSGNDTVVFRYTPSAGDLDSNGVTMASVIDLNGGTVSDSANNELSSVVITPPTLTGVNVDALAPTISYITPPDNNGYGVSSTLDFIITFSKAVNITGTPRLILNVGGATKYALYLSGTGTPNVTFRYSTILNDFDDDGISTVSPLTLSGGTIKDSALNAATLTFTGVTYPGVLVDAVPPLITSVTAPTNTTYQYGGSRTTLDFTVSYNKSVIVTGTPRIELNIGGTTRYASYVSGSNSSDLLFRFTLALADNGLLDLDGIEIGNSGEISLNGGTISDIGSNQADLNLGGIDTSKIFIVLPSMRNWYDLSDLDNITLAGSPGSYTITKLNDKIGTNNFGSSSMPYSESGFNGGSQAYASCSTTTGRYFSPSPNWTWTTPLAMIAVYTAPNTGNTSYYFLYHASTTRTMMRFDNSSGLMSFATNTKYFSGGTWGSATTSKSGAWTVNESELRALSFSSSWTGRTPNICRMPGEVAEVIMFTSEPTVSEVLAVEQYLFDKYGLSLP